MTLDKSSLPYRACVGIVLFNQEDKVFVGERIDTPGAWQMPQGGVDKGESLQETALRELEEEIGTNKAKIIKVADKEICYDLPDKLIPKLWNGKYRGQSQIWVAMQFTGKDSDINLERCNHPEFSAWQWVDLPETLDLIVPFKRDIYTQVIEIFSDIHNQ